MAVELTEEEQVLADATEECLNTLFGEGAFEAFFSSLMNADAIQACIKQVVVDCLLDPDTSPLTKEFLGTIFQGTAGTEEGLAAITDETGESPLTFNAIKIKTVTLSQAKTVVPVRGG